MGACTALCQCVETKTDLQSGNPGALHSSTLQSTSTSIWHVMVLIPMFHAMVQMPFTRRVTRHLSVVLSWNPCRMARPIRPHQLYICCMYAFPRNARLKHTALAASTLTLHHSSSAAWLAVADQARQMRIRRLLRLAWRAKGPGFKRLPRQTAKKYRSAEA